MSSPSRQPLKRPALSDEDGSVDSPRKYNKNDEHDVTKEDECTSYSHRQVSDSDPNRDLTTSSIVSGMSDNSFISSDDEDSEVASVFRSQSRCSDEINSKADASHNSCESDIETETCYDSNFSEYEVSCSSSSFHMDSNLSDSSTSLEYKTEKINMMCDKVLSSDHGYLPDDSEGQLDNKPKTNLGLPSRFKNCLQCRKLNSNPYYQYCFECFKFRKEYFENKPNSKKKRIKLSREKSVPKDSQESSLNFNSKDIETSMTEMDENSNNLCNICLTRPKNGVFNHGKIGHVYSCYQCAKQLWKKTNKCPLCNVKIKFVTRMITG